MLHIAGIGLSVRSSGVPLICPQDPAYASFLVPSSEPSRSQPDASSNITVDVSSQPAPPNSLPVLFTAAEAWSMQPEDERGYRLSFFWTEPGPPHTVARCDHDTTEVVVHLDRRLAQAASGATTAEGSVFAHPLHYPLDQLLLMNHLSSRGGVIVHAAGAVIDGRALIFPGVSGAGKSTLSRAFTDAGLGDALLSDDRVIVRSLDGAPGHFQAWGTPWPGEAQIARNACAPLAALLFLVKASANEVVPLAPGAAMRRLMPVVSGPWYDAERSGPVLDICARIVENVPCYDLRFRPGREAVALVTGREWKPGAASLPE